MAEELRPDSSELIKAPEKASETSLVQSEKLLEAENGEHHLPVDDPAREAAHNIVELHALNKAEEAIDNKELDTVLDGIDFSDKENYQFFANSSYHAEASEGTSGSSVSQAGEGQNLVTGTNQYRNIPGAESWGSPRNEAYGEGKTSVEKVGIRESTSYSYGELAPKKVPRRGLLGRLGFKKKEMERPIIRNEKPDYIFDYEFAAGTADPEVGNNTGQNIKLAIKLSKEQAEGLSKILAENPLAARDVVDRFVRETGDYGKWNAEIFDQEGQFHDPGERYSNDLLARDVRPNYEAAPDLKPQIVGLVGTEVSGKSDISGDKPTPPPAAFTGIKAA